MAIWMEVRCDLNISVNCWDYTNRMVSYGGWELAIVKTRAREKGWRFTRDGEAHCPACQKEKE